MPAAMRSLPLPEDQKALIVDMQFRAQQAGYETQYPGSSHCIVERDGEPLGRLWTARGDGELRIVDIALVASARGSGVGSTLLRDLLDEAAAAGLTTALTVDPNSPARALYLSMGFRPDGDAGHLERMVVDAAVPAPREEPPDPAFASTPAAPELPAEALAGMRRYEEFAPLRGVTLRVLLDDQELDCVLQEVRYLAWRGPSPFRPPRPSFSLLFRAPATPFLGQGTQRLRRPDGGVDELFLVPVGEDADGVLYESLHT